LHDWIEALSIGLLIDDAVEMSLGDKVDDPGRQIKARRINAVL
jgi:hypothetical protein